VEERCVVELGSLWCQKTTTGTSKRSELNECDVWSLRLGTLEEKDVRLGAVDHVVLPAHGLLHTQLAPLPFVHQAAARDELAELLGEDHVAVLGLRVVVLLAVEDLGLQLHDVLAGLLAGNGVQLEVVRAGHRFGLVGTRMKAERGNAKRFQ